VEYGEASSADNARKVLGVSGATLCTDCKGRGQNVGFFSSTENLNLIWKKGISRLNQTHWKL
jgi:hypothetical protein